MQVGGPPATGARVGFLETMGFVMTELVVVGLGVVDFEVGLVVGIGV
jgi:hypothetical protein